MRRTLPGCLCLALAACGPAPPQDAPAPAENAAPAEPLPDADIDASLGELNAPPPPVAAPRFVGRWAAEERLCATSAWHFTATGLTTPAGSVCRFEAVAEAAGGFDIRARCTAEAPERDDLLKLRFAESARAMLFEAGTIADAGLVRCGE